MKILLSTTLIWNGYAYHSGDVAEIPDDLAAKYIAAGSATRVDDEPVLEAATLDNRKHQNTMRQHQPQLRRR